MYRENTKTNMMIFATLLITILVLTMTIASAPASANGGGKSIYVVSKIKYSNGVTEKLSYGTTGLLEKRTISRKGKILEKDSYVYGDNYRLEKEAFRVKGKKNAMYNQYVYNKRHV